MFSIVTPNRNRLHYLKAAIPSWQRNKWVSEIVVADYGSDVPIRPSDLPAPTSSRSVQVEGTDDWRIGHASNIGVDHATSDCICKLQFRRRHRECGLARRTGLGRRFLSGHYQTSVPTEKPCSSRNTGRGWAGTTSGFPATASTTPISTCGFGGSGCASAIFRRLSSRQSSTGSMCAETTSRHTRSQISSTTTTAARSSTTRSRTRSCASCINGTRRSLSILRRLHRGKVVTIKSEPIKSRYANEDMNCQLLGALGMYAEERTRKAIGELQVWLISQAGGFGERPARMSRQSRRRSRIKRNGRPRGERRIRRAR